MLFDRRGDIYAWVASLMIFVAIPLASLSIDIVRMMYIRGHLHTATDAACQAAVDPLDYAYFISTGQARIDFNRGRAQAREVFQKTLVDAETVRYVQSLTVDFPAPRFAHCVATAQVSNIIPFTPNGITVRVETTSEMRVRYGN